jgi:hypothetical protein
MSKFQIRACRAEAEAKAGNPWSFLKIFAIFSNLGRQILEKDGESK